MHDMKRELARSLCPYTKFHWHDSKDMCRTCRAIEGIIEDFRDDVLTIAAKNMVKSINEVVSEEGTQSIGWREWLEMLYNPRKYISTRLDKVGKNIIGRIKL